MIGNPLGHLVNPDGSPALGVALACGCGPTAPPTWYMAPAPEPVAFVPLEEKPKPGNPTAELIGSGLALQGYGTEALSVATTEYGYTVGWDRAHGGDLVHMPGLRRAQAQRSRRGFGGVFAPLAD